MAPRSRKLEIRVAPEEHARFARAANRAGLGLSTWARALLTAGSGSADDLDEDRESTDEEIAAFLDSGPLPSASTRKMREQVRRIRSARWLRS